MDAYTKTKGFVKIGNSYGIIVPVRYIKDGHLDPNKTYKVIFEEVPSESTKNKKEGKPAEDNGPFFLFS